MEIKDNRENQPILPPQAQEFLATFKPYEVSLQEGQEERLDLKSKLARLVGKPEVVNYFAQIYWDAEAKNDPTKSNAENEEIRQGLKQTEEFQAATTIMEKFAPTAYPVIKDILINRNRLKPEELEGIDQQVLTKAYFRVIPHTRGSWNEIGVGICFRKKRLELDNQSWLDLMKKGKIEKVYQNAVARAQGSR